jgi:hypothetical protein
MQGKRRVRLMPEPLLLTAAAPRLPMLQAPAPPQQVPLGVGQRSAGGIMAIVDGLLFTLTFVTALGCGLIAGLFFAFSVAVMQALARLPAAGGIAAMQSINSAILNPLFLSVFLGTAAGCALVMLTSLARWHSPSSLYLLVGGCTLSRR